MLQVWPPSARAEEHVRGVVDDAFGSWRETTIGAVHWKRYLMSLDAVTRAVLRLGRNVARLLAAPVVARHVTEVLAGVDDVGIGGVGHRMTRLAAADPLPVADGDARAMSACREGPATVPKSCSEPRTQ